MPDNTESPAQYEIAKSDGTTMDVRLLKNAQGKQEVQVKLSPEQQVHFFRHAYHKDLNSTHDPVSLTIKMATAQYRQHEWKHGQHGAANTTPLAQIKHQATEQILHHVDSMAEAMAGLEAIINNPSSVTQLNVPDDIKQAITSLQEIIAKDTVELEKLKQASHDPDHDEEIVALSKKIALNGDLIKELSDQSLAAKVKVCLHEIDTLQKKSHDHFTDYQQKCRSEIEKLRSEIDAIEEEKNSLLKDKSAFKSFFLGIGSSYRGKSAKQEELKKEIAHHEKLLTHLERQQQDMAEFHEKYRAELTDFIGRCTEANPDDLPKLVAARTLDPQHPALGEIIAKIGKEMVKACSGHTMEINETRFKELGLQSEYTKIYTLMEKRINKKLGIYNASEMNTREPYKAEALRLAAGKPYQDDSDCWITLNHYGDISNAEELMRLLAIAAELEYEAILPEYADRSPLEQLRQDYKEAERIGDDLTRSTLATQIAAEVVKAGSKGGGRGIFTFFAGIGEGAAGALNLAGKGLNTTVGLVSQATAASNDQWMDETHQRISPMRKLQQFYKDREPVRSRHPIIKEIASQCQTPGQSALGDLLHNIGGAKIAVGVQAAPSAIGKSLGTAAQKVTDLLTKQEDKPALLTGPEVLRKKQNQIKQLAKMKAAVQQHLESESKRLLRPLVPTEAAAKHAATALQDEAQQALDKLPVAPHFGTTEGVEIHDPFILGLVNELANGLATLTTNMRHDAPLPAIALFGLSMTSVGAIVATKLAGTNMGVALSHMGVGAAGSTHAAANPVLQLLGGTEKEFLDISHQVLANLSGKELSEIDPSIPSALMSHFMVWKLSIASWELISKAMEGELEGLLHTLREKPTEIMGIFGLLYGAGILLAETPETHIPGLSTISNFLQKEAEEAFEHGGVGWNSLELSFLAVKAALLTHSLVTGQYDIIKSQALLAGLETLSTEFNSLKQDTSSKTLKEKLQKIGLDDAKTVEAFEAILEKCTTEQEWQQAIQEFTDPIKRENQYQQNKQVAVSKTDTVEAESEASPEARLIELLEFIQDIEEHELGFSNPEEAHALLNLLEKTVMEVELKKAYLQDHPLAAANNTSDINHFDSNVLDEILHNFHNNYIYTGSNNLLRLGEIAARPITALSQQQELQQQGAEALVERWGQPEIQHYMMKVLQKSLTDQEAEQLRQQIQVMLDSAPKPAGDKYPIGSKEWEAEKIKQQAKQVFGLKDERLPIGSEARDAMAELLYELSRMKAGTKTREIEKTLAQDAVTAGRTAAALLELGKSLGSYAHRFLRSALAATQVLAAKGASTVGFSEAMDSSVETVMSQTEKGIRMVENDMWLETKAQLLTISLTKATRLADAAKSPCCDAIETILESSNRAAAQQQQLNGTLAAATQAAARSSSPTGVDASLEQMMRPKSSTAIDATPARTSLTQRGYNTGDGHSLRRRASSLKSSQ